MTVDRRRARATDPRDDQPPDQPSGPIRADWRRPVLIELVSALLVVGGAVNLLLSIQVLLILARQGTPIGALAAITIALATASLAMGIAIRFGRGWIVTINVAAVLGFLELLSGDPVGLTFGAIDVFIVIALAREKPWFDWLAERRAAAEPGR